MARPYPLKGLKLPDATNTSDTLQSRINAALPQTQCMRCGFPDCAAYASAIAEQSASINQCPPGGAEGIARLAAITGQAALALNPIHGQEGPRSIAVIDETWCIGCTLCLDVCPTDAIFGSNKMMHTVIEAYCTGCELCLPVCPVDCISLENVSGGQTGWAAWSPEQAKLARSRYDFHLYKRTLDAGYSPQKPEREIATVLSEAPNDETPAAAPVPASATALLTDTAAGKRAVINAALARSRALRQKT